MKNSLIWSCVLMISFIGGCARQSVINKRQEQDIDPRAVERFIDAQNLDNAGKYMEALLSYQEALLYDPESPDIHLAMARNYLLLGKEELGAYYLQKTLIYDPQEIEALNLLSKVFVKHRKFKEAEQGFLKIVELDSAHVDAHLNLGMLAESRQNKDEAIGHYKKALKYMSVPDTRLYLQLGDLYLETKRFEEGVLHFDQLINQDPENGLGYYGKGLFYEAKADIDSAEVYYEKALEHDPGMTEAAGRLEVFYLTRQDWDKALELFLYRTNYDKDDIDAWIGMADMYNIKNEPDSAEKIYRDVAKRYPDDGRSRLKLGHLLMEQGKTEEALSVYLKITEIAPQSPLGWMHTGIAYAVLDSLSKAEQYLVKANASDSANFFINYYLGMILVQQNKNNQAISYLEQALKTEPEHVDAMGLLASAYESRQYYEKSDSLFTRSLEIDPDNGIILNNYAYSLAIRREKLDQAQEMAEKALDLEPENGAFLDTAGWIHFLQGKTEKAREYTEKAWKIRNTSFEIADHLGDIYYDLGLKEKAALMWQEALKLSPEEQSVLEKLNRL